VSPFPHLKTEADAVFETLFSGRLEFLTIDKDIEHSYSEEYLAFVKNDRRMEKIP
jgi:hypothetical protein